MQHDVVGPVTRTFADKVLIACFDGLSCRGAVSPIGEVDECRCAAEERGTPNLLGSGRDERRAVRLDPHVMQVHMRVYAARHDDMPPCIDFARGRFG
ncbi:MAG: hypothetical protein WBZ27_21440 [Pseudolabrys sp.]